MRDRLVASKRLKSSRNRDIKSASIWKSSMHLLSYIILLNIAIFFITIVLHEAGHLAVGHALGCSGGNIVLTDLINPLPPGPYTNLICPVGIQQNMLLFLYMSGFLFIVPFGLAFLSLKKFPEKNLTYLVLGSGFILGAMDIYYVSFSFIFSYLSVVVGLVLFCLGEIILVDEHFSSRKHKERLIKIEKNIKEEF